MLQLVWLLFLPFPDGRENVIMIWSDAGRRATRSTRVQRTLNATVGRGGRGWSRWRAGCVPRRPLRRLLLPAARRRLAVLVLAAQAYYRLFAGEFMRPTRRSPRRPVLRARSRSCSAILRAQFARAGVAGLVVALQQAPGRVAGSASCWRRRSRDPSLELVYWLPGFETYVDGEGKPVGAPGRGLGLRVATPVDHDGKRVAALIHDAALTYEPELLEVVCAAVDVALERGRLQHELESRVEELAGSRARLVEAGDEARRQIERDLHDGAQQRLVSLAIALRMTEDRIKDDPETAATLVAAARQEVSASLEELRELARGIHPAVLEHGLDAALESLAARSRTPVRLLRRARRAAPRRVELAAYFVACEGLANVGKYAQASGATIRVSRAARRRGARGRRRRRRRRRPRARLGPARAHRPRRGGRRRAARGEPGRRRDGAARRAAVRRRYGEPHPREALPRYRLTPGGRIVAGPACLDVLAAWSSSIPIALIALHVLDDNFLQPEPGTSAGDHLVSGLVPLALLALAAWAYPRLRGGRRGRARGDGRRPRDRRRPRGLSTTPARSGPSGDDFTGLLCLPAGRRCSSASAPPRSGARRRTDGTRRRRYARRGLVAFGAVLGMLVVGSLGYGHVTTHMARAVVPPTASASPHEDVRFTTADGLELEGWYIPSRNGAAVISFPGPQGVAGARAHARPPRLRRAAVRPPRRGGQRGPAELLGLGRRRRRQGRGRLPRSAAPTWTRAASAAIGLSVGGELLIETAAETDALAAVVSDGAGRAASPRTCTTTTPRSRSGRRRRDVGAPARSRPRSSADQRPPADLQDLAAEGRRAAAADRRAELPQRRGAQPRLREGGRRHALGDPRGSPHGRHRRPPRASTSGAWSASSTRRWEPAASAGRRARCPCSAARR